MKLTTFAILLIAIVCLFTAFADPDTPQSEPLSIVSPPTNTVETQNAISANTEQEIEDVQALLAEAGILSPCDTACDCQNDETLPGEDDLPCPCMNNAVDNNNDPNHNMITNYHEAIMEAKDIKSKHNTMIVNQLHLDTVVHYPDGTTQNLNSIMPMVQLHVDSGCPTPVDRHKWGNNLSQSIAAQVRDKLTGLGDITRGIANDAKSLSSDAVRDSSNAVKDKDSGLGSLPNRFKQTLGNIGGGSGGSKPRESNTRQKIILPNQKKPLHQSDLAAISNLIHKSFKSNGINNVQVQFISQTPLDGNKGYALVYEVKHLTVSEAEIRKVLDKNATGQFRDDLRDLLDDDDITIEKAYSVSAANSECVQGQCSADCQCELYFPCSANNDCLSNNCDEKTNLCAPPANNAYAMLSSVAVVAGVVMMTVIF